MNVEIFCACDSVSKDDSGLSLHGISNSCRVPQIPCVIAQFCIVARVRFELSEEGIHEFHFTSTTADLTPAFPDHKITMHARQLDPDQTYLWCSAFATNTGVHIQTAQDVYLQLAIDGKSAASTTVYIRAAK